MTKRELQRIISQWCFEDDGDMINGDYIDFDNVNNNPSPSRYESTFYSCDWDAWEN